MSAYQVAALCRRCLREPALRARLLEEAPAVLQELELTDAERTALLEGDVGELYLSGAPAFLLSYLPRWGLFGLDVATYSERMRAAAPAPAPRGDQDPEQGADAAMPLVRGLPPEPPVPAAPALSPALAALLSAKVDRLGYLGGFFAVAARQPAALEGFIAFTEALQEALPHELVQVVALRVASRLDNAYERSQHVALCRKTGLSEQWIGDVLGGAGSSGQLEESERLTLRLVDAVLADAGHGSRAELGALADARGADTAVAVVLLISRYVAHAHAAGAFALVDPTRAASMPPTALPQGES